LDDEDLFCANCGTSVDAPASPQASSNSQIYTHHFECRGCGASMSYDASAQKLRCPYCGSEQLEKKSDNKTLAPSRVIPFQLAASAAQNAFAQWLGRGFWRPSDLVSAASIAKMSAVYVPYWVFAADVHTYWTADSGSPPFGARGNWYPVTGENRNRYQGLLVGASRVLSPDETQAIGPFDLSQGVPPDQIDLENSTVEQFTVPRKYARPLAQEGLEQQERQACARKYFSSSYRNLKVNVRIERLSSEPILLPVWVVSYRYRNRLYRILINGQTGRVNGDAPYSWLKLAMAATIVILLVLGILMLAAS
jgi:DNA-directed RNA polymerase subunit RPC12/RpoP